MRINDEVLSYYANKKERDAANSADQPGYFTMATKQLSAGSE